MKQILFRLSGLPSSLPLLHCLCWISSLPLTIKTSLNHFDSIFPSFSDVAWLAVLHARLIITTVALFVFAVSWWFFRIFALRHRDSFYKCFVILFPSAFILVVLHTCGSVTDGDNYHFYCRDHIFHLVTFAFVSGPPVSQRRFIFPTSSSFSCCFLCLSPSCVSFHSRRLMFPQRLPGTSTYRRELVTLSPIGNSVCADRKRGNVFVRAHVITRHVRMSELHDSLPGMPLWDVCLNVCTCHPVACPLRIALLLDNNILAKKTREPV